MTIAERIQSLRKARGLSQEELAEQVGVSRQAVGKWEAGQSQPDLDKVIALSGFFGVSCDYLLKGEESPSPASTSDNRFEVPPMALKVVTTIAITVELIGLVLYVTLSRYFPASLCILAALIGCILGTGFFIMVTQGLEISEDKLTLHRARRNFWSVNVWLVLLPFALELSRGRPWNMGYGFFQYISPWFICYAIFCAGISAWLQLTKK